MTMAHYIHRHELLEQTSMLYSIHTLHNSHALIHYANVQFSGMHAQTLETYYGMK